MLTQGKWSIRRQLLAWLLIPLSCLWLVLGVIAYFLAMELTTYAYDRSLVDMARYVGTRLRFPEGLAELDLPPAAEAVLRDDPKDKIYFQVVGPRGRLIGGDRIVPLPTRDPLPGAPAFRDDMIAGKPVRVVALSQAVPGGKDACVLIQAAETLHEREHLQFRILLIIVIPELVTVFLAALAIWFGVSRGLSPLQIVQDAVASRSPSDLSPVPERFAPKEVRPLVRAINDLLRRLEKEIDAQRRFVANAAHQLRTPIAGLKTHTQLALRQSNLSDIHRTLKHTHTSVERCSRLVHQLLVLARVEPGALHPERYTEHDLNAIARSATEEVVPEALAKGIDLGFESAPQPVFVKGDGLSLYELVFNLVENAVRYTQPSGNVTVRVTGGDTAQVVVEDNGPGIPAEERERVFERFYRVLGTRTTGSGLGLAIVSEIAQAHGAKVVLADGPRGCGSSFIVSFASPVAAVKRAAHKANL